MKEMVKGIGVVSGIAIAPVKVLSGDWMGQLTAYSKGTPEVEAEKIAEVIKTAAAEILQVKEIAQAEGKTTQADIMQAHHAMVNDPGLAVKISEKVGQGIAAPQAVLEATEEFAVMFEAMSDPYLQERAVDVRDIGRRLVRLLLGVSHIEYGHKSVIVCAQEIEPSVAASMPDQVCGILLGQGSTTSHTVIIAKARGIPTITGLGEVIDRISNGTAVIMDGSTGQVIVEPSADQVAEYRSKAEAEAARKRQDNNLAALPAVTLGGRKLQLAANIGSLADMPAALMQGAEGVGLFRSEFLFLGRDTPPTEEEQFAAYKEVAVQCGKQLCIIRTMDIGGDKPLHYLQIAKEENPFLGWRAIRISLKRQELFITQLKAILRAGAFGHVAIMLPMIISAAEIAAAKACIKQAAAELTAEGKPFAPHVPLGIMIETPAAAITARELASECDFFSIGTNDLVQYTLAVDRGNPAVSSLYSHFHPAVLRLIHSVVQAGHEQGIWVGICGEMAGDPLAAPLLAAMGLDELSMSASSIPRVKEVIRALNDQQIEELLATALSLKDADDIRVLMENFINGNT